ncbi:MAG: PH domain-containing protein [Anaerolineae bacterium]|jgi:membrane protein YdbS with pleckstrin-like domain
MTDARQLIRCDRRYLGVRLGAQIAVLAVLAMVGLLAWHTIAIAVVSGILALFAILKWIIRQTWKFTVGPDQIRTEKLFTSQIDLRTPLEQIVGINAYEGILEAILGVGTIEISTASSQRDHVAIKWPHLRNARSVANSLETHSKEK